jgi:single-strand DNA-binding protein
MANLNKVMLIGRLTRDPEVRTFGNGGKVAKLGFAVNNRRKDQQSGEWKDEPVFLDCEVFNRGESGRQADLVEQSLKKGHQVYLEGHLRLDSWEKDGQKRSKIVVVVDNFQFLEPRSEGGGSAPRSQPASRRQESGSSGGGYDEPSEEPSRGGGDDDIPF